MFFNSVPSVERHQMLENWCRPTSDPLFHELRNNLKLSGIQCYQPRLGQYILIISINIKLQIKTISILNLYFNMQNIGFTMESEPFCVLGDGRACAPRAQPIDPPQTAHDI